MSSSARDGTAHWILPSLTSSNVLLEVARCGHKRSALAAYQRA